MGELLVLLSCTVDTFQQARNSLKSTVQNVPQRHHFWHKGTIQLPHSFSPCRVATFSQFAVPSCWQQQYRHIDCHSLYKNKLSHFSLLITSSQGRKCWHSARICAVTRAHNDDAVNTSRWLTVPTVDSVRPHCTPQRLECHLAIRAVTTVVWDILFNKMTGCCEEGNELLDFIRREISWPA
jgi:hypothetical protein